MTGFPADIVYNVLDFVPEVVPEEELKTELSTFSLLSITWRDRAREKLFSDVRYSFRRPPGQSGWDGAERESRWGRRYGEREDTPYKTLAMLVDFFEGHEHCASHVISLSLVAYPVQWQRTRGATGPWEGVLTHEDRIDPELLARLLQLLPKLERLELRNVVPSRPMPDDRRIIHPCLNTLTMLYNSANEDSLDVYMVLRCFAKIPTLCLIGTGNDTGNQWDTNIPSGTETIPGPSVEHLSLSRMRFAPPGVLEMLALSASGSLEKLYLQDMHENSLPLLQTFIDSVGPELKVLKYELMTTRLTESVNQFLNLSRCNELEDLHLTFDIPAYDIDLVEQNVRMIASILLAMAGAEYFNLQEITSELLVDYVGMHSFNSSQDTATTTSSLGSEPPFHRPPSAERLERALLDVIWRSISSGVSFICVPDPTLEKEGETEAMVTSWFPTLANEGRIEFL